MPRGGGLEPDLQDPFQAQTFYDMVISAAALCVLQIQLKPEGRQQHCSILDTKNPYNSLTLVFACCARMVLDYFCKRL